MKLTHLDENGAAHMVNIGAKPITQREAVAQSVLTMQPETLRMILDGTAPKGDVFACARIAGIMAAKRTAELIPMCHPIPIESVDIAIEAVSETQDGGRHRRGDGSPDRRFHSPADHLRHVQGGGPRYAY